MNNKENINELKETVLTETEEKAQAKEKGGDFKFFKCCSASLKRFSVVMFVVSLFFAVAFTGVGVVLIGVYMGTAMLTVLALPVITLFVILIVIARFIAALIYGFAEIVENNEKNSKNQ